MQTALEAEDPGEPTDEFIIRARLDEVKDVCQQFRLRQPDLDALNDLGYRLPLNKNDAARLHVINNR